MFIRFTDLVLCILLFLSITFNVLMFPCSLLAIRNVTGHYYLNGNWRIDFPRSIRCAGTIFHYERKPHGFFAPETITALGPTIEAIYIVVRNYKCIIDSI